MKIAFLDTATVGKDVDLTRFEEFGELVLYSVTRPESVLDRCIGMDVIITNKVKISREHIEALPDLKLICLAATGMDNIDCEAAAERGIPVKNVKGYSTDSVAQIALAMVLSLQSKLSEQDRFGKNEWTQDEMFTNLDNPFAEIVGKKWGIIGLGDIGRKVAQVASAMGADVRYYSTSGIDRKESYESVPLDELLGSDIISIHCPLSEKTKNLVHEGNIKLIKDDAVLVNVARGGVVNERAIVDRFKRSNIRLGFDVASVEPIKKENPLMEIAGSRRLILTPHIAWSSVEARARLLEGIYENIKEWAREAPPLVR